MAPLHSASQGQSFWAARTQVAATSALIWPEEQEA